MENNGDENNFFGEKNIERNIWTPPNPNQPIF